MEKYMTLAVHQAHEGQTPFGAVIVRDGEVLAAVHNTVRRSNDPTAHAEVNAIREACKHAASHKLPGAALYTTCEPCPMCSSAAFFAGIRHIYYGASIPTISRYLPQIHLSAGSLLAQADAKVVVTQQGNEADFEALLRQYS